MDACNPLDKRKMRYTLEPDAEGYPAIAVESLWVRPLASGVLYEWIDADRHSSS